MAVLLVSTLILVGAVNRAMWLADHPEVVETRARAAVHWYFELFEITSGQATSNSPQ